jgi:hypothetical protein
VSGFRCQLVPAHGAGQFDQEEKFIKMNIGLPCIVPELV